MSDLSIPIFQESSGTCRYLKVLSKYRVTRTFQPNVIVEKLFEYPWVMGKIAFLYIQQRIVYRCCCVAVKGIEKSPKSRYR